MPNQSDLSEDVTFSMKEAIESLNDREYHVFQDFRKFFDDRNEADLCWHWELGVKAAQLKRDIGSRDGLYGQHFIKRLAAAIGLEGSALLYSAIKVADTWPSKKEFRKVVSLRGPLEKNRLTWTHITLLSTVPDVKDRDELIDKVLAHGLSTRQLHVRIQQLKAVVCKEKRISRQNRKTYSTVNNCLEHMTEQCSRFKQLFAVDWLGEEYSVVEEIRDMPPDEIDTSLGQALDDSVVAVRNALEQLRSAEHDLAGISSFVRDRIDRQPESQAKQTNPPAVKPTKRRGRVGV